MSKVVITADNRRADIETYLTRRHVKSFVYLSNLAPSAFDQERSLQNQARLGSPLQQDLVDQYVNALRAGEKFPPLLAWRQPDGRLQLMDGNHRLAAYITEGKAVDAYECECGPEVRVKITMEANTRHGRPLSHEDRIHHSLYMVDNGMNIPTAASMFQLDQKDLRKAINIVTADRRSRDAGVPAPTWDRLTQSLKMKLNAISTNEVFAAVCDLAQEAGYKLDDVSKLILQLNRSKSVTEQLAIVGAARADALAIITSRTTTGNGLGPPKAVNGPRQRLRMAFGQLRALNLDDVIAAIPTGERGQFVDELEASIKAMTEIRDGLRDT